MPSLCDVNFLLPLVYRHHTHHHIAREWLEAHSESRQLVVCRVSQLALLRLLCNRAVMKSDVQTLIGAWGTYDALRQDDRFTFASEPDGVDAILRQFTTLDLPALQLWQDAYLASFAVASGVQLVTFDRAFRQFKGLDLMLLGE